ncbi:copine-5-like [Puntigrus tetrazona]|uniref:copine-5-like n=1 Tax=Puntigrus tetrazona TaxID=1606681 RepID=UPI001C8A182F|nr:copine-5-like [Puntigrus tetrazona]
MSAKTERPLLHAACYCIFPFPTEQTLLSAPLEFCGITCQALTYTGKEQRMRLGCLGLLSEKLARMVCMSAHVTHNRYHCTSSANYYRKMSVLRSCQRQRPGEVMGAEVWFGEKPSYGALDMDVLDTVWPYLAGFQIKGSLLCWKLFKMVPNCTEVHAKNSYEEMHHVETPTLNSVWNPMLNSRNKVCKFTSCSLRYFYLTFHFSFPFPCSLFLSFFLSTSQDCATMQFCANKLDKKDFFGRSDPFMVFYRSNEDGTFTICHKTEVVKNTLNPVWQPFTIPVRALCNGDYDRTIKVEVYDWDRDGSHDFIGEFTTSYRELARGQSQFNIYEVVNPKKKMKKKKYVNSGTVTLLSFSVESESTFLDYIKGGTQINFTVAIDFTASNGNPSQSTSLHYMNPYQMNAYALALKAVGEIIQDYDSDKMFPALGFGAKLPPDGRVSHEFPLNGNIENPYCNGIEGILEAYHQSLKTVQLYGPTNFAPVVNHVARYAAAVQDGSQYFVLLIITDGVISDMSQTKEAIVNVSITIKGGQVSKQYRLEKVQIATLFHFLVTSFLDCILTEMKS